MDTNWWHLTVACDGFEGLSAMKMVLYECLSGNGVSHSNSKLIYK